MRAPRTAQRAAPQRGRLARQRQVATVLSRHGFGLLVRRSPLPIPGRARLQGRPESLVAALEELGTTFIKLGQILSTRSDLLSEDYIAALSTLQDRLPPIPLADVRAMVTHELGAPPEALFADFAAEPLATASIGQVHAAALRDGRRVVVKVQKPGIAREVELDLLILRDLTRIAAERIDLPLVHNLEGIVEHFSDNLRAELDYQREGRNAERFARALGPAPRVAVPRIHWELTTGRVLTMDLIGGVKITDLAALDRLRIDRRLLARDLANLVLRQIIEWGFFHADPHPGNYFVDAGGVIGVVDFGMVGTLDETTRRELLLLLSAWVAGDADGLAEGLVSLGVARGSADPAGLRADMRRVLGRYHDANLGEIHLGQVMSEVFRLARRHDLVLRGDLALMGKTLAMHEGLGMLLDPKFELVQEARPYVEGALRRLFLPHTDLHSAALNISTLINLAIHFPRRAERLLARLERGDLGLAFRPEGVEWLLREFHRMVNRIAATILAASFIVGLALLLQLVEATHGAVWLLLLLAGGLLVFAALGLWLLASVWRAGRPR